MEAFFAGLTRFHPGAKPKENNPSHSSEDEPEELFTEEVFPVRHTGGNTGLNSMEEEVVAEDASFSRGADAEEDNNGSYRREDEPGQENKEENVMEEEEQLMMELQMDFWERHSELDNQIHTSTTMTSEISSITDETSHEEITISSKSEKHVTSSSIDKSEVDRLRELNERLGKTIAFLMKQNNSLKVKVERLTKKEREINSISWEEEKSNRAEEIEVLEEKNKSLNQSLEKEINGRIEAEKKLGILEREKEELKLEIKKLEKKINIKEETISKLKEINETEKEQTLETTEITRKGGFNVDIVDGIGIDIAELRKNILEISEKKFTDIKSHYKTKVENLEKTVDEKEAELAEAHEENIKYARQIEDYQSEVSSFKEKLEKADVRYLTEISRLNKELQKIKAEIKAMEEKTEFHSQTTEETTKVELDTELIIYKEYLDLMEGRFKIHETDESAGGEYFVSEESTETMKKTETKTKIVEAYYDQEKIHHSQETETSVSQHEEAENQGQGGSPGTVGYNQGWNGTKDWSEHFKERQTFQNPDSPEEDQPKSDPQGENKDNNQGKGESPGNVEDDPSLQNSDSPEEGQSESDPEADSEEDDQGPNDSDGRVYRRVYSKMFSNNKYYFD